jgi:glutamyl-tRNA reductase
MHQRLCYNKLKSLDVAGDDMHIVVLGLNHQTAPVEIRERFAFSHMELPTALQELKDTKSVLECVIVATCNRTEIYAVVDRSHLCSSYIPAFIEQWFYVPREQFTTYGYMLEGSDAVKHLFRVACGLDSMMIGETQILGQVRDAFLVAQEQKATGALFNTLFKQAITLAKRAHSETAISENPVSISYAAVELGKGIFGTYQHKKVMIIGAGKMSELTLKYLCSLGVEEVVVVNRTYERAAALAQKIQGIACKLEEIHMYLYDIDVIISSTGSHEYILTHEQLEHIVPKRSHRPLFILDTAVPRDIDPRIGELADVYVYDIDDLQSIVELHMQDRLIEAKQVEHMVEQEVEVFANWMGRLGISPVIHALQQKAKLIHEETMTNILKKLPDLDEREVKVIRKLTKSMVNQMLRDPIQRLKEMVPEQRHDEVLNLFTTLFALENNLTLADERASYTSHSTETTSFSTVSTYGSDTIRSHEIGNKPKQREHKRSSTLVSQDV